MLYYRYAEKFNIQPQDVPHTVTVKAFIRWLVLEKAEAARDVWLRYRNADDKQAFFHEISQQESADALYNWPMFPGVY